MTDVGDAISLIPSNTAKYLNQLSDKLHSVPPVLKSFYVTRRFMCEKKHNLTSPDISKKPTRCSRCGLRFADTVSQYYLKSGKKELAFHRKLVNKQKAENPLTRFQAAELSKSGTRSSNRLEITCSFCQHKTVVPLQFTKSLATKQPKSRTIDETDENSNVNSNTETQISLKKRKRKKKKNKDKFCGLDESAVLTATPNKPLNITFDYSLKKKFNKSNSEANENNSNHLFTTKLKLSFEENDPVKDKPEGDKKQKRKKSVQRLMDHLENDNQPLTKRPFNNSQCEANNDHPQKKKKFNNDEKKKNTVTGKSNGNQNQCKNKVQINNKPANFDPLSLLKKTSNSKSDKKSKHNAKKKLQNMLNSNGVINNSSSNLQEFLKSL